MYVIIITFHFHFYYYYIKFVDDAIHLATTTTTTDTSHAYLSPYFESLNTKNYFGCKALDFCCSVSNNICVLVSGKEFSRGDRVCFDQCIRRIVKDISQDSEKTLTLVVDTSSSSLSGPADQKAFEISLETFVKSTAKELSEVGPTLFSHSNIMAIIPFTHSFIYFYTIF